MNAKQIKNVRDFLNWDNREMATALGVQLPAVWHWLAGRRKPPLTVSLAMRIFLEKPEVARTFLAFGRKRNPPGATCGAPGG